MLELLARNPELPYEQFCRKLDQFSLVGYRTVPKPYRTKQEISNRTELFWYGIWYAQLKYRIPKYRIVVLKNRTEVPNVTPNNFLPA